MLAKLFIKICVCETLVINFIKAVLIKIVPSFKFAMWLVLSFCNSLFYSQKTTKRTKVRELMSKFQRKI